MKLNNILTLKKKKSNNLICTICTLENNHSSLNAAVRSVLRVHKAHFDSYSEILQSEVDDKISSFGGTPGCDKSSLIYVCTTTH